MCRDGRIVTWLRGRAEPPRLSPVGEAGGSRLEWPDMTPDLKTLDWKTLLLSPRGRIGRTVFFAGFGVVMAASIVLNFVPYIGSFAHLVLLWPLACLLAKRLHDAGRTSALLLLPLVVGALALGQAVMSGGLGLIGLGPVSDSSLRPAMAILALTALLALGFVAWVGLSRGERAANRYGASPHGEVAV